MTDTLKEFKGNEQHHGCPIHNLGANPNQAHCNCTPPEKQMTPYSREWWLYEFAGMAMSGLIESSACDELGYPELAHCAVKHAKSLLAELEKETK